jgi:hypothetical protein
MPSLKEIPSPPAAPSSSDVRGNLLDLRRHYAFVGDESLITAALEEVPTLYALLENAAEPLRLAFGQGNLLQLEALESDEGIILRVMVKLPPRTENAPDLMGRFQRSWWFKNCSSAEASLVFDYEISDGF